MALAAVIAPASPASDSVRPMPPAVASAAYALFPASESASLVVLALGDEDLLAARSLNDRIAGRESLTVAVVWAAGAPAGFVVVDDVKGKDLPITYMVAVDTALRVVDLRILAYRESYGGEVRNEAWRRQFIGRSAGAPLRHGREIRNITGATISARAVTGGVRDVLALLAVTRHRIVPERARP